MNPTFKPSQVLRKIKSGEIKDPQPRGEGKIVCNEHGHPIVGHTESPSFWENGSYVYCGTCKAMSLVKVHFKTFSIDLTGERKSYPNRLTEGKK